MSKALEAPLPAKRQAKTAAEETSNTVYALLEAEVYNSPVAHNGHGVRAPAVPAAPNGPSPSWGERLQEFFFGWALKRYKSHPIVTFGNESSEGEQYKILREKLKRRLEESKAHCYCISSPVKGDGKTLVAVNLAVSTARAVEQNVLLIDADLRAPQIHNYFNLRSSPGLVDYLSSRVPNEPLAKYLHSTFLPNLWVLPAGSPSDFSSELLTGAKMAALVQELRSTYKDHQIIFDTSPILITPEPLALARHLDGILMVARVGQTPHECLAEAFQHLHSIKVIGMVLNDVEQTAGHHYYYRYRR